MDIYQYSSEVWENKMGITYHTLKSYGNIYTTSANR
ncbi:hypothetical protein Palpr_1215 [Paludibacter propionicigenes WB4]|uniref:Uncharacterized protein n=1 Tax=Paludibacter propionicigenes (strain DSM 17365 / JCM 13257 / WB4) TaxID=694427 RepID=E4T3R8_PALPW|nr:hypothetical protein Palpr_1215 [Paludibacter propionicigenes WB4]